MSDEQDMRDAADAERLLNDPAFKRIFEGMRDATIQKWRTCYKQPERDDYWRLYNVICLFPDRLKTYVQSGNVARLTIEQRKSWTERMKQKIGI